MRINTISFKLVAFLLTIVSSVLIVFGLYSFEQKKMQASEELQQIVDQAQTRLQLNLPGPIWEVDDKMLQQIIDLEVDVASLSGVIVYGDDDSFLAGVRRTQDGAFEASDEVPYQFSDKHEFPLNFNNDGKLVPVGRCIIFVNNSRAEKILEVSRQSKIVEIISLDIVILIMFSIAIRTVSIPLTKLTAAAKEIADGNYDMQININLGDEVGDLAKDFDQMRNTIKKKLSDLSELNQIGETLAASTSQNQSLEIVLKTMHRHCNVHDGSIFLFNDQGKLEMQSCYPPKVMDQGSMGAANTFAIGEGVMGLSAEEKKVFYIHDTQEDHRFISHNAADNLIAKTLIVIPLVDQDIVMGVINLTGDVGEVHFENSDFEYSESIARLLVITIKNIRMREVIEEHNRSLEEKVKQRTVQLQEKTNDIMNMMKYMHQGLFTITKNNNVHHEYSSFLEDILNTNQIAGKNFKDILFEGTKLSSDQVSQVEAAVGALQGSDEMMWDFNKHALIKEVVKNLPNSVEKQILELDWNPIVNDGTIDKIMVTVRDVSEEKALQIELEKRCRELEIVGEIINIEAEKYQDFMETSRKFLQENRLLIESTHSKNADAIAILLRNMHTIERNSITLGFPLITAVIQNVGTTYDKLRKEESAVWDVSILKSELAQVEEVVDEYDKIAKEKLRIRVDTKDEFTVSSQELKEVLKIYDDIMRSNLPASVKESLLKSKNILHQIDSISIDKIAKSIVKLIPSLARDLHKPEPTVLIKTDGLLLKKQYRSMLNNVLMYLIRDSIDHGLEDEEVRKNKGKPLAGRINVLAKELEGQLMITIYDDGKGLDLEKIAKKAEESGKIDNATSLPKSEIANLVFFSGLSTADKASEVSGRGIGLNAIKKFIENEGGTVTLELFSEDCSLQQCPFKTVIQLPSNTYVRV